MLPVENPLSNTVRLYYLGGIEAEGREITWVTWKDKTYIVPKVGEFIEVPEIAVKHIVDRHKWVDADGRRHDAFTTDSHIAKRYAQGLAQQGIETVSDLSDEAILAEAKRRGLLAGSDESEESDEEDLSGEAEDGPYSDGISTTSRVVKPSGSGRGRKSKAATVESPAETPNEESLL